MSYIEDRYEVCAIDCEMGSRVRIKTATLAVNTFKHITLFSTLQEALDKIDGEERFDVIFISERFPEAEAGEFIKKAKESKSSQDAAFILLILSTEEGGAKAAQSIFTGFDGCLMEPYSVDSLVEITKLTARVKNERREAREKAAVDFLVKNIMKQVDRMAYIHSAEMEAGLSLKQLKESCEVLRNFQNGTLDYYFEEAAKLFEQAAPNATLGKRQNYHGVSRRIKKKIVKQLLQDSEREKGPS